MSHLIINKQEFDRINLEESHIYGFYWRNDSDGNPTNLEIEIDWNEPFDFIPKINTTNIQTKLCCYMVHDAQFNFEFKGNYTIGDLEITSFAVEKIQESSYLIQISFNFAPIGYIRFKCVDFNFEIQRLD